MSNYWKSNLKLIGFCLLVWFSVSFLAGVVFVEFFNRWQLGGYPLGFWIAQQGAMFAFVALIFFYNSRVSKLDKKYRSERSDVDQDRIDHGTIDEDKS